MSSVTRVNGAKTVVGTVHANNCNLYLISVKTAANAAVNLTAEDSAGANAITDGIGVVEAIVREICPLAYFTPNNASGTISIVVDLAIDSADALQLRVRTIGLLVGGTTSIGPNGVDISGTLVVAASTFTVA